MFIPAPANRLSVRSVPLEQIPFLVRGDRSLSGAFDWGALTDVISQGATAATKIITTLRIPAGQLQQTAVTTTPQTIVTTTPSDQVKLTSTYGRGLDPQTQQYLLYGGLGLFAVLLATSLRSRARPD